MVVPVSIDAEGYWTRDWRKFVDIGTVFVTLPPIYMYY